jgi:septin 7
MPFGVVGASDVFELNGKKVRGRKYPWGLINIENEEHCDFIKLRQLLIRSFMEELREHTNQVLYESYRTYKMKQTGGVTGLVTSSGDTGTLARLEQTKIAHDQKMAKMEAEMRAVFQQKVAEKEAKLKQSESEVGFLGTKCGGC